MPFYIYECTDCSHECKLFHSMAEKADKCPDCGSTKMTKKIGHFLSSPPEAEYEKSKNSVNNFIKDSRQDLIDMKSALKKGTTE